MLELLQRQARRLRFTDPVMESAFMTERIEGGLTRARVILVAAMAAFALGGWADIANIARTSMLLRALLQMRVLAEVACAGMLLSTWLPGHTRRAEWVNALGVAVLAAYPVLAYWHFAYHLPKLQFVGQLIGNLMPILAVSAFALPLRARTLAVVITAVLVPGAWFFRATVLVDRASEWRVLVTAFFGIVPVVLLMAWWREAGERTMFAQREHARRLNAELERANAELARLNAEKNEFMAVAAHDLRAPLGVVRGLLELLREGRIAAPEKRDEALRQALGETGRMHALVENYLGAHAAESGVLPVRMETIDLGAAAHELAARHGATAAAKRQALTTDAPAGRVRVTADAALLAQVGDNFVTNALKFSPAGAAVRIELLAAPGAGVARLAVVDAGPGVSLEEQGKLFRKFSRGAARPTAGESSAGLGLATARRLAEAMDGRVGCESPMADGCGACFWIELPEATS
ncbi:MAG: HAMP domain-containing histidine kinase [Candidatus Didemnitutus sp.]|nr:HAMP domain-containing histidine kinase [Candidatus Didemnitutus sp.]